MKVFVAVVSFILLTTIIARRERRERERDSNKHNDTNIINQPYAKLSFHFSAQPYPHSFQQQPSPAESKQKTAFKTINLSHIMYKRKKTSLIKSWKSKSWGREEERKLKAQTFLKC